MIVHPLLPFCSACESQVPRPRAVGGRTVANEGLSSYLVLGFLACREPGQEEQAQTCTGRSFCYVWGGGVELENVTLKKSNLHACVLAYACGVRVRCVCAPRTRPYAHDDACEMAKLIQKPSTSS